MSLWGDSGQLTVSGLWAEDGGLVQVRQQEGLASWWECGSGLSPTWAMPFPMDHRALSAGRAPEEGSRAVAVAALGCSSLTVLTPLHLDNGNPVGSPIALVPVMKGKELPAFCNAALCIPEKNSQISLLQKEEDVGKHRSISISMFVSTSVSLSIIYLSIIYLSIIIICHLSIICLSCSCSWLMLVPNLMSYANFLMITKCGTT